MAMVVPLPVLIVKKDWPCQVMVTGGAGFLSWQGAEGTSTTQSRGSRQKNRQRDIAGISLMYRRGGNVHHNRHAGPEANKCRELRWGNTGETLVFLLGAIGDARVFGLLHDDNHGNHGAGEHGVVGALVFVFL